MFACFSVDLLDLKRGYQAKTIWPFEENETKYDDLNEGLSYDQFDHICCQHLFSSFERLLIQLILQRLFKDQRNRAE